MTAALLAALLLATDPGAAKTGARTDLYGDPLPPGVVARLGTIWLRHGNADIAFSADGKTLISAGIDGMVCFWDVAAGKQVGVRRLDENDAERGSIRWVGLAPGGDLVAVWRKDTLFFHDTATGRRRSHLPLGERFRDPDSATLIFSRDGKYLIVVHDRWKDEPSLQLWDMVRGEKCPLPSFFGVPKDVAISPDGKRALARTAYSFCLWDLTTGEVLCSADPPKGQGMAFSPDGKAIAVAEENEVALLDTATLQERGRLKEPDGAIPPFSFNSVVYSADGGWLAAAGSNGVVVWEVAGNFKPRCLGRQPVFKLAISPRGRTVAYGGRGVALELWDVVAERRMHDRPGHGGGVPYLAASSDGKYLVSRSPFDPCLLLWDVGTGRVRHRLSAHDTEIGSCLFTPDGKRIIAAGGASIFQMWDTTTGENLRPFAFQAPHKGNWGIAIGNFLSISPDGKRLSAVCWRYDSSEREEVIACSWSAETGKLLSSRPYSVEVHTYTAPGGGGSSWLDVQAAFMPGAEGVTARIGRVVNLEDVSTNRVRVRFPAGVGRPMTFSPDGRLAAAAILEPKKDSFDGYEMKDLCLIETATGQEVLRLKSGERSLSGSPPTYPLAAFSRDGRSVVLTDAKGIRAWDSASGASLLDRPWLVEERHHSHRHPVQSLVVLPSGRVATGMDDGTILIWDLVGRSALSKGVRHPLDPTALEMLWSDLAGDPRMAHRAIYALTTTPNQALSLLKDRLRPVVTDTQRVEKLLADLDGDSFAAREAASRELGQLRDRVESMLGNALEGRPSPEMRRRLQTILAQPDRLSADTLRTVRAIAVLERIGTPEARRILEKLAGGAPSRETREAKASLKRLGRR